MMTLAFAMTFMGLGMLMGAMTDPLMPEGQRVRLILAGLGTAILPILIAPLVALGW